MFNFLKTVCSAVAALTLALPLEAAEYEKEVIASGLDHPWSMVFLPNGDMLVTERAGRLRVIRDDKLLAPPVKNVPKVYVKSQAGLFDLQLDPDFVENRLIYLSYAHGTRKANALRIARARLQDDQLMELEVLFTVAPLKNTSAHYGGRMVFLPDGTLFSATGDGFEFREQAQKLDNLFGKTIRINKDGSIPKDNPFIDTDRAKPEIWSYGHRNPQGVSLDPKTGNLYLHEHGARGGDELNLIERGKNYGWPAITYSVDYSGATISPYTEHPKMEQPLIQWTPSIAPSGMTLYNPQNDNPPFPQWRGNLFASALAERTVRRLTLERGKVIDQQIMFTDIGARIRDVKVGPKGYLYLLTDSSKGKVIRIKPK